MCVTNPNTLSGPSAAKAGRHLAGTEPQRPSRMPGDPVLRVGAGWGGRVQTIKWGRRQPQGSIFFLKCIKLGHFLLKTLSWGIV